MGVVSGVVMSYEFGTNWSRFSDKTGNVLGPLLAFEVLTAFFLEASFLGVMIFGWGRVTRKMHYISTLAVAVGTVISAFWILSANSWMQTPSGFEINELGIFHPTHWLDIIFNPSFPYRFIHMLTGAYLTTAFFVGGVGAWYLLKNRVRDHARIMLGMAMLMALFVAPLQIFFGDQHGLNTFENQPAKISAIEGIWENEKGASLILFGWPDEALETTKYALKIPNLASLILTHDSMGEVKGLKNWPKEERPPVVIPFWCFRIMVAIGCLMALTGIFALVLYLRGKLFQTKWFQIWSIMMAPSGFIAILSGWFVTEVGRQPYLVYGHLKTIESASPVLGEYVFISLLAFVTVYFFVFGAGIYYIGNLIRGGPSSSPNEGEVYGSHGLKVPPAVLAIEGKNHV